MPAQGGGGGGGGACTGGGGGGGVPAQGGGGGGGGGCWSTPVDMPLTFHYLARPLQSAKSDTATIVSVNTHHQGQMGGGGGQGVWTSSFWMYI